MMSDFLQWTLSQGMFKELHNLNKSQLDFFLSELVFKSLIHCLLKACPCIKLVPLLCESAYTSVLKSWDFNTQQPDTANVHFDSQLGHN